MTMKTDARSLIKHRVLVVGLSSLFRDFYIHVPERSTSRDIVRAALKCIGVDGRTGHDVQIGARTIRAVFDNGFLTITKTHELGTKDKDEPEQSQPSNVVVKRLHPNTDGATDHRRRRRGVRDQARMDG